MCVRPLADAPPLVPAWRARLSTCGAATGPARGARPAPGTGLRRRARRRAPARRGRAVRGSPVPLPLCQRGGGRARSARGLRSAARAALGARVGRRAPARRATGPRALKVVLEKRRERFGALGGLSVAGERAELAWLLDRRAATSATCRSRPPPTRSWARPCAPTFERLADHVHDSPRGLRWACRLPRCCGSSSGRRRDRGGRRAFRGFAVERCVAGELARRSRRRQGELRPYQLDGYRWLVRLAAWGGGVLADDMGLGKRKCRRSPP